MIAWMLCNVYELPLCFFVVFLFILLLCRTAEEQFVKDRDQNAAGSEWERVSKLCDFNPKVSKGNKDVGRMRSTLLHLKQKPRAVTVPDGE